MALTTAWKVTGQGGKNKYGRYDRFKTVEVIANTKDEAVAFAKAVMPADKQEVITAKEYAKVSAETNKPGVVG